VSKRTHRLNRLLVLAESKIVLEARDHSDDVQPLLRLYSQQSLVGIDQSFMLY
jgi:hypothetical protein